MENEVINYNRKRWLGAILCVCLLVFGIFFASCRSKKINTTSKLDESAQIATSSTETSSNDIKGNLTENFDFLRDFTKMVSDTFSFTLITYDTNKRIDSTTGKPPILSKMTGHRSTKSSILEKEKGTSAVTGDFISHSENVKTDTSNFNFTQKTEIKTENKTGLAWWQKTLIYVGIGSLVILILWVIFRLGK